MGWQTLSLHPSQGPLAMGMEGFKVHHKEKFRGVRSGFCGPKSGQLYPESFKGPKGGELGFHFVDL